MPKPIIQIAVDTIDLEHAGSLIDAAVERGIRNATVTALALEPTVVERAFSDFISAIREYVARSA